MANHTTQLGQLPPLQLDTLRPSGSDAAPTTADEPALTSEQDSKPGRRHKTKRRHTNRVAPVSDSREWPEARTLQEEDMLETPVDGRGATSLAWSDRPSTLRAQEGPWQAAQHRIQHVVEGQASVPSLQNYFVLCPPPPYRTPFFASRQSHHAGRSGFQTVSAEAMTAPTQPTAHHPTSHQLHPGQRLFRESLVGRTEQWTSSALGVLLGVAGGLLFLEQIEFDVPLEDVLRDSGLNWIAALHVLLALALLHAVTLFNDDRCARVINWVRFLLCALIAIIALLCTLSWNFVVNRVKRTDPRKPLLLADTKFEITDITYAFAGVALLAILTQAIVARPILENRPSPADLPSPARPSRQLQDPTTSLA
ncbi:uncharacterized protein MONBRDRAFT_28165 [Monosiga brevicollis MX1]|uniref:Uncharacterized protein n=1 Tax=Monosiga brevicollis TaxID=81824 RepID=A9V7D9_MONBE|nr:uncharacterized protein MONBRDRAFT_28165 [Monosiga brevicollis MX1]EDQ86568.1 predicted protein [Monosiga brevicollis MX1]|eukprot:XP_001748681.1 hypothetical protein [Monosiga brevicollis MX1]